MVRSRCGPNMNGPESVVEPEVAQVYKTERNGIYYQILHVDEQIVLLRSNEERRTGDKSHRMERRVAFDKKVESGKFIHQPESDLDLIGAEDLDWSEVSYIGEKTSENLHAEGYTTNIDIQQADESELLMVDGLGAKGLENLRSFAR